MTLDGKISTAKGDSKISSPEDLQRVHELRSQVDAIMVGVRTLLKDDPKLTTKKPGGRNPMRVIVDSLARTPPTAQAITVDPSTKTLIAVTSAAPTVNIAALQRAGAEVFIAGSGRKVDLQLLMQELARRGVSTVMLEGGGTLNWSMLSAGLVDEIRLAVAPVIVGGEHAVTLVEGNGVDYVELGVKLSFEKFQQVGRDVVLTYRVVSRVPFEP